MRPQKIIKLVISLVLFMGLFLFIDLDSLLTTLQRFPRILLVSILLGYLLGQVLSAYKWWIILRKAGIEASFLLSLRAYFVGMFANILGVGTVGGDLTRALIIASGKQTTRTRVLGTVATDRGHGLATLACIGFIVPMLLPHTTLPYGMSLTLVALAGVVIVGWTVVIFGISRLSRPSWFPEKVFRLLTEAANSLPRSPVTVLHITTVSLCFHLLQISLQWLLIRELEASASYLYVLSVVPYVNIASTLPLSWQGLGVRENAYIFFLVPTVLGTAEAVAVGAVWFMVVTTAGALGGLWALLSNDWRMLWNGTKELESPKTPQTEIPSATARSTHSSSLA